MSRDISMRSIDAPFAHPVAGNSYGKLNTFDGTRGDLRPWIRQAKAKLAVDSTDVSQDIQVQYLFGRLMGKAARSVDPWMEGNERNGMEITTEMFFERLRHLFASRQSEKEAENALRSLRQGTKAFSDHYLEFCRLLSEAGGDSWPEQFKIDYLRMTTNRSLTKSILGVLAQCGDIESYAQALQAADNDIEAYAAATRSSPRAPPSYSSNAPRPPVADSMDWEYTRQSKAGQEGARKRAKWVTPMVRDERREKGLCIQCGAGGHFIDKCPYRPPARPRNGGHNVRRGTGGDPPPELEDDIEMEGKE